MVSRPFSFSAIPFAVSYLHACIAIQINMHQYLAKESYTYLISSLYIMHLQRVNAFGWADTEGQPGHVPGSHR